MNPFSALAEFALGWMKQAAISAWLRFLFEIIFSAVVAFLFVFGSVLVSSKSWPIAMGTGCITASVCMTVIFRKEQSKLTRGMFIVLPESEAVKEVETDLQTINKEK